MKFKTLTLFFACFFCLVIVNGQIAVKDSKFLNLGLGLGTNLYSGAYHSLQVPPISASFEFVVKDQLFDENSSIGIGGYLAYTSYKYSYSVSSWKYSSIVLGPRGYFHYFFIDKLDTYTGILLGYNILTSKWTGTGTSSLNTSGGGVAYAWFIGGRYFFSDNIAAMAELGYGVAYLNIGICIKM